MWRLRVRKLLDRILNCNFKSAPKKRGLIILKKEYQTIYEVEEISTINNLTKIRVIDSHNNFEPLGLWVESDSIDWRK